MSWKWVHAQRINMLEVQAAFAFLRRRAQDADGASLRQLTVLDSKVATNVLAKGRSSSRRLNRLCRRVMALCMAADLYPLVLWTVSRWNSADKPSRAFEQKKDQK